MYIILLFILSEYLFHKKILNSEITRKIVHMGSGFLIAFLPYILSFQEIIWLGVLTSVLVFVFYKIKYLKSVFSIERKSYGARIFIPTFLGLYLFFWNNPLIFTISILIESFSDSFAFLVGKYFGKKKIWKTKKTYIGSFVFFITTFFILAYFLKGFTLFELLFMSIILTLVEIFSKKGLDNFFIPFISSFMIYFLLLWQ